MRYQFTIKEWIRYYWPGILTLLIAIIIMWMLMRYYPYAN